MSHRFGMFQVFSFAWLRGWSSVEPFAQRMNKTKSQTSVTQMWVVRLPQATGGAQIFRCQPSRVLRIRSDVVLAFAYSIGYSLRGFLHMYAKPVAKLSSEINKHQSGGWTQFCTFGSTSASSGTARWPMGGAWEREGYQRGCCEHAGPYHRRWKHPQRDYLIPAKRKCSEFEISENGDSTTMCFGVGRFCCKLQWQRFQSSAKCVRRWKNRASPAAGRLAWFYRHINKFKGS